jgi:hypothetical protein
MLNRRGMAFRMGQDLGFQRDPKNWSDDLDSLSTPTDNEFRRRIYWGCYISDKHVSQSSITRLLLILFRLFSLFLGRPTVMHENDSDVENSHPIPYDSPMHPIEIPNHVVANIRSGKAG